jgi:hypothetical protein
MNRDLEAPGDRRRQVGVLAGPRPVLREIEDRLGAFVRTLRPRALRQQAWQAVGLERRGRLVEGLTTDAERGGDVRDRPSLDPVAPDHFVFHLDTVARVEERILEKRLVVDALGVRMERAGASQGAGLEIWRSGGSRHRCHRDYATRQIGCQGESVVSCRMYRHNTPLSPSPPGRRRVAET